MSRRDGVIGARHEVPQALRSLLAGMTLGQRLDTP
jgi:hypothetical protein